MVQAEQFFKLRKKMPKAFVATLVVLLTSISATAVDTLFEGYSKILANDKAVGYTISRYQFDPKKQQFVSTYFIKTSIPGSEITESLNAFADKDLKPVSYQYTSIVNKDIKTIDATFKKNQMSAVVIDKGVKKSIKNTIDDKTFLSTFLVYWILLKTKQGLKVNEKYTYSTITEENGMTAKGAAHVEKNTPYAGLNALLVQNEIVIDGQKLKFESLIDEKGEVLSTKSPANGITTELTANPTDATASFKVNQDILKKLFGNIPEGTENVLSKKSQLSNAEPEGKNQTESTSPHALPGKQQEVPQGQGIQIKKQSK